MWRWSMIRANATSLPLKSQLRFRTFTVTGCRTGNRRLRLLCAMRRKSAATTLALAAAAKNTSYAAVRGSLFNDAAGFAFRHAKSFKLRASRSEPEHAALLCKYSLHAFHDHGNALPYFRAARAPRITSLDSVQSIDCRHRQTRASCAGRMPEC